MKIAKVSLLALVFLAFSCGEKEDPCIVPTSFSVDEEQHELDISTIDQYLDDNDIDAQIHSTGFRYVVHKEGTGKLPNLCNTVVVAYQGRLLDGFIVDQTPPNDVRSFALSNLINGWKAGIPLVKEGGEITLYLPSTLAYGSSGAGSTIPGDAVLIFDITLFAVR